MSFRFGSLSSWNRFSVVPNFGRGLLLEIPAFGVLAALLILSGCHREVPEIIADLDPVETTDQGSRTGQDQFATRWHKNRNFSIAPGIHVLGELSPSVAYVIETKKGAVLVDTGVQESGHSLREMLVSFGLRAEDIGTILLTHAHYDHVFGANKLRQMSGATLMAGREDCETLRRADLPALFSVFPRVAYSGDPIEVDRELVGGERLDLGDVQIEVIATPGHTPGSTCYLLEKDSKRYLMSGDVVASLNLGPATYPTKLSPRFRGDAKAYLDTIHRLSEMEPPNFLLPGHPQQQNRTEPIELEASTWHRLLESARVELETLVARYQRDGADFLDDEAKSIEPKLYYLGKLDDTAVYCIDDPKQLVVVNAPGDDRFAEFLTSRLSMLKLDDTLPKLVLLTSNSLQHRSGLRSLEGEFRVVTASQLSETLRDDGLDVVAAGEIQGLTESRIQATELANGLSYSYRVGERTVLFTQSVPRNITMTWVDRRTGKKTFGDLQPQMDELIAELSATVEASDSYSQSLDSLRRFTPDVWLPATPLVDQNANLYDDDWTDHLDANRRAVDRARASISR